MSSQEHIIQWANYVKTHKDWKRIHTEFINAQFIKHKEFIARLLQESNGKEKIERLKRLKISQ